MDQGSALHLALAPKGPMAGSIRLIYLHGRQTGTEGFDLLGYHFLEFGFFDGVSSHIFLYTVRTTEKGGVKNLEVYIENVSQILKDY